MDWRGVVAKWLYRILGIAVIFVYAIPFMQSTNENPTGGAGSFAPLIALYTAMLILLRSRVSADANWRVSPDIMIGLGSLFTAHLWLVDSEGISPLDVTLPLLVLLALIPGVAITVWLFVPEIVRAVRKRL